VGSVRIGLFFPKPDKATRIRNHNIEHVKYDPISCGEGEPRAGQVHRARIVNLEFGFEEHNWLEMK
jgi:hypothetical protein